jgi:hypothetical protein
VGGKDGLLTLCMQSPFREALHDAGDMLPRGCIVATCNLTAVYRIPRGAMYYARQVPANHPLASYPLVLPPFRDDKEWAFGDYTPGRYAWLLHDVEMLAEPVPVKGSLGLWEWTP